MVALVVAVYTLVLGKLPAYSYRLLAPHQSQAILPFSADSKTVTSYTRDADSPPFGAAVLEPGFNLRVRQLKVFGKPKPLRRG